MPIAEPQLIRSELFAAIGVTAFFTGRRGGVSHAPFDTLNFGYDVGDDEHAVAGNMQRLIAYTSLTSPPHQARQVHASGHLICSGEGSIHDMEADILITGEAGCPVAVRTADCLPILLADPVAGVVAAVHAGWKGTAGQIAGSAIRLLQQQGAKVENIHAALGPCIGPCCFEIGEDTADRLAKSATDAGHAIERRGKPYADLAAINIMQLRKAGISGAHIESNHACTCCHQEQFYSYRRDHGRSGRHLAVVALPDAI